MIGTIVKDYDVADGTLGKDSGRRAGLGLEGAHAPHGQEGHCETAGKQRARVELNAKKTEGGGVNEMFYVI